VVSDNLASRSVSAILAIVLYLPLLLATGRLIQFFPAPVYCNVTVGLGPDAICGGEGATVNTEDQVNGLNFGQDYCLSG
jgi:hypothetical protein